MSDLFHAYIIEGGKEDAKSSVLKMLEDRNLLPKYNSDSVLAEYVNFSIDDARSLKEWQMMSATTKNGKAYIALCEFINNEAQNALLKTFEEPVKDTHIFLSVKNASTVLPTLKSRVQIIKADTFTNQNNDAKNFLSMTLPERIGFVGKLCEKDEDSDGSARVRSIAIDFLNSLEVELSKNSRDNSEKLSKIMELKSFLNMSGSSVKMILETIAMSI